MTARLTIDTTRVRRWLTSQAKELDDAMQGGMTGAGKILERETKRAFIKGGYRRVRPKRAKPKEGAGPRKRARRIVTWRIPVPPPRRGVVFRRTGFASRSINSRTFRDRSGSWNAAVGSPVLYVKFLEEGTKKGAAHPRRNIVVGGTSSTPLWRGVSRGGRIHPRRFMQKARKRKRPDMERFIQRRIDKFTRDAEKAT